MFIDVVCYFIPATRKRIRWSACQVFKSLNRGRFARMLFRLVVRVPTTMLCIAPLELPIVFPSSLKQNREKAAVTRAGIVDGVKRADPSPPPWRVLNLTASNALRLYHCCVCSLTRQKASTFIPY